MTVGAAEIIAVADVKSSSAARWTPTKVKFHDRKIGLVAAGRHHAIAVTGQQAANQAIEGNKAKAEAVFNKQKEQAGRRNGRTQICAAAATIMQAYT